MTEEKPLHVRVAEALHPGWELFIRDYGPENDLHPDAGTYSLRRPGEVFPEEIPRYDLDWSATGPLIEKYGINLFRYSDGEWDANISEERCGFRSGPTPLVAICNLILAFKERK